MKNSAKRTASDVSKYAIEFLNIYTSTRFKRFFVINQVELTYFPSESRETIKRYPVDTNGKSIHKNSVTIYAVGKHDNESYKIVVKNDAIYFYYICFLKNNTSKRLQIFMLFKVETEWQIFLTSIYKEEYLKWIRNNRKIQKEKLKNDYAKNIEAFENETKEIINRLKSNIQ